MKKILMIATTIVLATSYPIFADDDSDDSTVTTESTDVGSLNTTAQPMDEIPVETTSEDDSE